MNDKTKPELTSKTRAPMAFGLRLAVTTIVAVLFITLYARLSGFTATDAFISFRYARNWALGNGIVFNPGERVEGYTNFLWVALTALLHHIPGALKTREHVLLAVKIMAFFFPIGIFLVLIKCIKNYCDRIVSSLFLLSAPGFVLWSVSGMETVAFAFLILLSCFLVVRKVTTRLDAIVIGLAFTLTGMIRPEGLLFVCLGFAWLGYSVIKEGSERGYIALAAIVFLLGFGVYTFWRIKYFGSLLPNTFYAKVGVGSSQLLRGADYLMRWSRALFYLPLVPVVLNLRKLKTCEPKHLVSIACIAYCLYVVAVGGDWMSDYRFFVPILPLIAWSYTLFMESIKNRQNVCRALFIAVILMSAMNLKSNLKKYSVFTLQKERNESEYIIAEWYKRRSCEDALIAMGNLGRLNYYMDYPVVDTIGLVDPYIARIKKKDLGKGMAGHEKQDPEYVLSRKPVFFFQVDVLLTSVDIQVKTPQPMLFEPTLQYLRRESEEFNRDYEKRSVTHKNRQFNVYIRKDSLNCLSEKVDRKLSSI